MLIELYIRNYTLIDELKLSFDPGLSVITGETGAGKSILLGALSLILGKRAETDVLMDKKERCVVEGHFDIRSYDLKDFFEQHDLDYADLTIFRREISSSGKSRAFINDTPVTLQVIKELGDQLVDVHSQHRTLAINQTDVQLGLLDEYAGVTRLSKDVRQLFFTWQQLSQKKDALEEKEKNARRDHDYKAYLISELEIANIRDGELAELESELHAIRNRESIRSGLWQTLSLLSENEVNITSLTLQAIHGLAQAGKFLQQAETFSQRLESARIEMQDIAGEINLLLESFEDDPEKTIRLEQRLDLFYNLLRKHDVNTDNELIGIMEELKEEQRGHVSLEEELSRVKSQLDTLGTKLKEKAAKLTEARKASIPTLEITLQNLLHELGMPEARFQVILQPMNEPGPQGSEQAQFMFNANRGGTLMELARVASGGERSRFMLAVKSCITSRSLLPTIIFDEIDTGISGEMATKVADMLQNMGTRMQVIAITHLPQIASKGKKHFLVHKDIKGAKTITRVSILSGEDRVDELAKMISGANHSEASRNTARELLSLGLT